MADGCWHAVDSTDRSMGLTSGLTVAVAAALTVMLPVVCLLVWNRLGHRWWLRLPTRLALIVAAQLAAVLTGGLALNDQYGFYLSWSELFGQSATTPTLPAAAAGRLNTDELRRAATAGHGTVISWVIPGPHSAVPAQPALIYLPAVYGDPRRATLRFPVVELLAGFPGHPQIWTGPLRLQQILDTAIAAGRVQPLIAVMPSPNVVPGRDTQCVNVAGGPQVETYLTEDVPAAVLAGFRVAAQQRQWALMGLSAGGYCALNLTLRHPNLYAAAASLSGYGRPMHNQATGDLFAGSNTLRDHNSPLWLVSHPPTPQLSLLAMTSRQDTLSYPDTIRLAAVARPPLTVTTVVLPRGGHNPTVWTNFEPTAFAWLSTHLSPPRPSPPSPTQSRPTTSPSTRPLPTVSPNR
jgi:S-formylglutathione hydrolase FrmB